MATTQPKEMDQHKSNEGPLELKSPTQDLHLEENAVHETDIVAADPTVYFQGLRLHSITAAVALTMFLTNLEIPIVSTSLVGITNDIKGFSQSSWIVSAYLLGYAGVLIIFAKLSDIFGRKLFLLISLSIFTLFSVACGAAQTITELIIFRAFQGVGGAGNFALGSIIIMELVPAEKYAAYTSFIAIAFSLSLLLGPIFGGAINASSTWRWIFLLNVPAGILAAAILFVCLPSNFPHHGQPGHDRPGYRTLLSRRTFKRVDFPGAGMLLVATILLVAALEEAGLKFPWRSGFVISLLTVSGALWIIFLAWERRVTLLASVREPVFPWRFITSRVWIGMLLNALFLGPPWFVCIFQLPQRFQLVNGVSPLEAGIRLMPFTFASPIGSIVSSVIAGKAKVPPIYLVITASILQIIGLGLLSTLPYSYHAAARQYGYQVIAGFGVGINISTLLLMTPFSVDPRDKAVAMGSVTQFRIMGGVLGLAIVTTVFNTYTRSRLGHFLTYDQIQGLSSSSSAIASLPLELQTAARRIYAEGYNLQIKVLTGFAAAQIPSSFLMWQKKQITV